MLHGMYYSPRPPPATATSHGCALFTLAIIQSFLNLYLIGHPNRNNKYDIGVFPNSNIWPPVASFERKIKNKLCIDPKWI